MEKRVLNKYLKNHSITITGFILPNDFSRRGKVLEVAIETEDFRQYIVTPNPKGKELFDLLYSNVSVHGLISGEDARGNVIIKIKDYKINHRVQFINE